MKLRERTAPRSRQEVRVRLEGTTFSDLEDYRRLYQEKYGKAIELPELAAEILTQLLAGDRAFRRWQRARAGRGNGAATSEVTEA